MSEGLPDNSVLSHYRIVSKIGAGGMGEVYLAQDTKLDRKVALKILPADVAADQTRMRRFVQEAKAASALNHPNIITIHEIEQTDSVNFIATEFIDGETLRLRMRHAPMKLGEVLDVAIQCASALSAAHATGIVHRDIKPENIMIRLDGIVKVLDFGLAKLTANQPTAVDTEAATKALFRTDPEIVLGTASYMSPEQARGQELDGHTDIFSLGVVVYEMVAGCLPFTGATTSEVLAAILSEKEPPPLARFARDVPRELEHIVSKSLRKDREERYQTIKDMLIDLKDLKRDLEVEARLERSVSPEKLRILEKFGVSPSDEGFSDAKSLPPEAGTPNAETIEAKAPKTSPAAMTPGAATPRTTSSAEYITNEIKQHKRGVAVALFAITLLSVAGIAYYFYLVRDGSRAAIDSIAVLPLVNSSNDPNMEYLSDGISEALINSLTELQQLRVIARATAFRYRGKDVDPLRVGRELNVRAVLMGRLRQTGDTLNVQVDLVETSTGAQLWGQEYERKVSNVLAVKQTIAREVTAKLRLRLSGAEQERLVKPDPTNAEAYQFYLRGRYFWNKRTVDGINKAIEQFQQALDRDPNYALGYVGLADCYILLELVASIPSAEILPKARDVVDRALQIDDSLAEAHTSSARIYQSLWRWPEVETEFKRAISLNPNYPTTHLWFSVYLRIRRQFDDAMSENKRAQELDPLSPTISRQLAAAYLLKNDFNSAIEQSQKVIALDPSFHLAHETLGWAYLKQRRFAEATTEFQRAVELSGRASNMLSYLGHCYAVSGRRAEARAVLKELEEKYARGETVGQALAGVYAGLGEKDQAFAWLERDFEQRSGQLPFITYSFSFEGLRSDPRYANLVRGMGLEP